MATLTVLIPTHNEGEVIRATIQSVLDQTVPADDVIVIADNDTAGAVDIARSMGVRAIECQGGSKALAQDAALPMVTTDLVLPLDADTILERDYIEKVKPALDDPDVTIAAGAVFTLKQDSLWSAARQLEYLQSFHLFRPIQQMTGSVVVCAGCCSVFRTEDLHALGGFPKGSLTEDIDYTLRQHARGKKAVYVGSTAAYADEPNTMRMMRTQLKRWKTGHATSVRTNYWQVLRRRPLVALWVSLQVYELLIAPVVIFAPLLALLVWHAALPSVLLWWLAGEVLTFWAPVLYGCVRRGYPVWKAITSYPAWLALKVVNFEADMRHWLPEFVLVPLGLRKTFATYEMGH